MKEGNKNAANIPGRERIITRVFDAPRDLVFKAWTDPNHVAQWWSPKRFTNPFCKWDARVGGTLRVDMCGPDGVDYPNKVFYREVKKPERLFYDHGEPGEPSRPGKQNSP